jgi:hypothetical protein
MFAVDACPNEHLGSIAGSLPKHGTAARLANRPALGYAVPALFGAGVAQW